MTNTVLWEAVVFGLVFAVMVSAVIIELAGVGFGLL